MGLKAVANLGSGGGGGVSGSGTTGALPIWSGATALGDSAVAQTAGAISSLTLTNPGAGATNGTYSQVALTGGAGTGATADIVVAGNVVTVLSLRSPGTSYAVGNTLSAATIGGAGFVFTVSAVVAAVNSTGNVTGPRVGAGTSSPSFGVDSLGGIAARAATLQNSLSFGATNSQGFAHLIVDSTGESGSTTTVPVGTSYYGARVQPSVDLSALTANQSSYGIMSAPLMQVGATSGTVTSWGVIGGFRYVGSAITAKTMTAYGVHGAVNFYAPLGTGNTFSVQNFRAVSTVNPTNAQTFSNWSEYYGGSTFSGAAHTITNYYGLQLLAPSLAGGATITNRYGISQEDTAATNVFAATTNTFSGNVRATGSAAATPAFSTPGDTDTGVYFPAANQVRIGTGGSPGFGIDASQNAQINSGYGSLATFYGCRAWVNFSGAAGAIRASGNVSSVTRSTAGLYTVNFTNALPDTNYAVTVGGDFGSTGVDNVRHNVASSTKTVSTLLIQTGQTGATVGEDFAAVHVAIFR